MNRRILQSKRSEIAKAGLLVFDAIFGESQDFERNIEQLEQADTEPEPATATAPPAATNSKAIQEVIVVEGYSFVSCVGCGREQRLPSNVDVQVLERHGWRCANATWRCPFCTART